jgi:hypothetical protein
MKVLLRKLLVRLRQEGGTNPSPIYELHDSPNDLPLKGLSLWGNKTVAPDSQQILTKPTGQLPSRRTKVSWPLGNEVS